MIIIRDIAQRRLAGIFSLLLVALVSQASAELPSSARADKAMAKVRSALSGELRSRDVWPRDLGAESLSIGAPIFIRVFKQESTLELWVQQKNRSFALFKTYPICTFSGRLGPKKRIGDFQAPEGFYFVTPSRLNPWSKFHLSMNLGYPNAYDRYHKRTGSALMIHGDCVSIGCYAMTDKGIEEIYTLTYEALKAGQPFVRVHVFPFKMNDKTLEKYKRHRWFEFWQNLKEGYDVFEENYVPPNTEVVNGRYVFDVEGES